MKFKITIVSLLFLSLGFKAKSQTASPQNSVGGFHPKPAVSKWSFDKPFEQKVFIENKGQYELLKKASSDEILFGARQDGLQYFFTKDGIWIKYLEKVQRSEKEMEKFREEHGEKESEIKGNEEKTDNVVRFKYVERFHRMEFIGAGKSTTIIPEEQIATIYNFSPHNTQISAHAFKKITYKNLYQGIDMEIYFPSDKQGFKYNLILQAGANPNQIQIKYPLNENISLSNEGNVLVKSIFGDFTDHAPVASEKNSAKQINCSFSLTKGIIKFNFENYDSNKEIIIDPWTTTPVFTGGNNAYDVDWDNYGNCYAYGGTSPFQVLKFNPAGGLVWSYTTAFGFGWYYGDFAVDRVSCSVYMVDGFNGGAGSALKINSTGALSASFGGNSLFQEMWRISFSKCTNQAVIAGGGTTNPSYTGAYLDTNLVGLVPVDVINSPTGLHDMWGLTLDAFGFAYFVTAQTQVGSPGYDNIIYKVPTPALNPILWQTPEGYSFIEVASVNYAPGPPNGFNGTAISNVNLYTYDSYVLKKWSTASGALLGSANVNGASTSTMTYGGLDVDDCDNIFMGKTTNIVQYSSALTQVGTIAKPGSVYDVALGQNNILYSCGLGFVSADVVNLLPCSILQTTMAVTNPSCGTPTGSATVTVSGGTAPYTYSWNTTPVQTTNVASNLPPGTYIVTIKDNSCIKQTTYDTVIITSSGSLPLLAVTSGSVCPGGSIALTASGATTYTWSPGTGLSTISGPNVTATPTITTTYTVTGSAAGCNGSVTSTVTVNPLPVISVNSPTVCVGTSATMNATGASTYTWSSGGTGAALTVTPATTTNYTITGTDANGCISAGTATVSVNALPIVTATSSTVCPTSSATITASGASTYTWNTGATTASITAAPVATTNYTVTATDINGCVNTTTATIVIAANLVVTATNNAPICAGATLVLSTPVGVSWAWSGPGGFTSTVQNPNIANSTVANTGTYTLTATDASGCFGTVTTNVVINPLPVPTAASNSPLCANATLNLTSSGGTGYAWSGPNAFNSLQQNPNITSVTAVATGTYTVVVTDANNCVASATTVVLVNPLPIVTVTGTTVCLGATINLTSTGGVSYSWSGPLAYASNQQNPSITNATAGMSGAYAVTVTDANGCVNGNVAQVTVNPSLVIVAGSNSPICFGATLNLTSNAGVVWNWSGPGGFTSASQNPTITNAQLTATGVYTVNAVDANGCAGSATTNVTINPLPVPTAVNNTPVCENGTINFTGTGGVTYVWIGPGGYNSSTQNPIITPAALTMNGTYTLTVIDNNSCTASTTTQVFVNALPIVTATSGTICIGNTTVLTANGAVNYSWNPGTGLSTSIGSSVNANPISTTGYTITGTDANGCVNTASSNVTVNPLPNVTANSTAICTGNSGTLTATGAVSYAWNPTTGLSASTGAVISANPGSTTSYTVTGTDLNGCVNVAPLTVTVNPLPIVLVSPATTSGCAPLCVNFLNTTTATGNCVWAFGDGSTSSSCTPNHCFTGKGTFLATLTLTDGNGCIGNSSATVIVYPVPNADFVASPQPTTILDPTIHFNDASSLAPIASYFWTLGDPSNTTSTIVNPSITYLAPGSYDVMEMVTSDQGCIDSIHKIIVIGDDYSLYVPNAFSPNLDGVNDVFMAKGEGIKDFKMYIFDRWGNQIFFSDDIFKGWDGRFMSKGTDIVQEDVYVWKIECKNFKGEPKLLKGTVSLLK